MSEYQATLAVIGGIAMYLLGAAIIARWMAKNNNDVGDTVLIAIAWPTLLMLCVMFSPVLFIAWLATPDKKRNEREG